MVIGGGLAGLSAACALADRGVRVTLLEKRPFLGGRAFSFADPVTGRGVDNGQHVFLRCCTAYVAFLERLGVRDLVTLQGRLRVPVMDARGARGSLFSTPWLPAPLHLLPSLLAFPHLGWREKLRALPAMLRILRLDLEARREDLERRTFRTWLEAHGQGPRALRRLWDLITLAVLNDTSDAASAYMGLMAFQVGLLRGRHSGDIGYARVGLTDLVGPAATRYITERGGEVLLGRPATRVVVADGTATGVEVTGLGPGAGRAMGVLAADAVVCATPWDALPRLLPPEWAGHSFFAPAQGLEAAPILGIHVWYDRPVMDAEFVAVLDSPVQWVFNRSRIQGEAGRGQHLCISLSGAWEHAARPRGELRDIFLAELGRLFPAAAEARVERFLAVRQPSATFRSLPGAEASRLPQRTPVGGLFLAGDWTRTGWPSTMESAVRSGLLAAELGAAQTQRARALA